MVYDDQAYNTQQAYDIGLINGISQNLSAFMTQMGLSGYPTGTVNENPYDQFFKLHE